MGPAFTKEEVDAVLKAADTSGDGQISYKEFVDWVFSGQPKNEEHKEAHANAKNKLTGEEKEADATPAAEEKKDDAAPAAKAEAAPAAEEKKEGGDTAPPAEEKKEEAAAAPAEE